MPMLGADGKGVVSNEVYNKRLKMVNKVWADFTTYDLDSDEWPVVYLAVEEVYDNQNNNNGGNNDVVGYTAIAILQETLAYTGTNSKKVDVHFHVKMDAPGKAAKLMIQKKPVAEWDLIDYSSSVYNRDDVTTNRGKIGWVNLVFHKKWRNKRKVYNRIQKEAYKYLSDPEAYEKKNNRAKWQQLYGGNNNNGGGGGGDNENKADEAQFVGYGDISNQHLLGLPSGSQPFEDNVYFPQLAAPAMGDTKLMEIEQVTILFVALFLFVACCTVGFCGGVMFSAVWRLKKNVKHYTEDEVHVI